MLGRGGFDLAGGEHSIPEKGPWRLDHSFGPYKIISTLTNNISRAVSGVGLNKFYLQGKDGEEIQTNLNISSMCLNCFFNCWHCRFWDLSIGDLFKPLTIRIFRELPLHVLHGLQDTIVVCIRDCLLSPNLNFMSVCCPLPLFLSVVPCIGNSRLMNVPEDLWRVCA